MASSVGFQRQDTFARSTQMKPIPQPGDFVELHCVELWHDAVLKESDAERFSRQSGSPERALVISRIKATFGTPWQLNRNGIRTNDWFLVFTENNDFAWCCDPACMIVIE